MLKKKVFLRDSNRKISYVGKITECYPYLFVFQHQQKIGSLYISREKTVSGKEDPLEHPYVILIHVNECQQSNQTRKKLFRDKLNE